MRKVSRSQRPGSKPCTRRSKRPITKPARQRPSSRQEFANALTAEMKKHGDNHISLLASMQIDSEPHARTILLKWSRGQSAPRRRESFDLLNRIEIKYGLPKDFFRDISKAQTPSSKAIKNVTNVQQHIVRWHLPDDFDSRSLAQRSEILLWLEQNVLSGSTDFGKYLKRTNEKRFRLRFLQLGDVKIKAKLLDRFRENAGFVDDGGKVVVHEPHEEIPPQLIQEMNDLVKFKRSTIAPSGFQRYSGWSKYTTELRANTYGRFFGAMMALPRSSVGGLGVPKSHVTMALMAFPAVWDWFLAWAEKRRGFYTKYELNTLIDVISLLRRKTGWIRQHPELANKLSPIQGLLTRFDVRMARRDWSGTCETTIEHLRVRGRELRKIIRTHRDSFEPILPVLKSDSPLGEYRKIADEVLKQMPDEHLHPLEVAEAVRTYLMLRFGMHLGFRQRNLRELLLCPPGQKKKGELTLRELRCGEIRWSESEKGWEVFIPSLAFKNWDSSFFQRRAYRHILPDLENLYYWIDEYVSRHRTALLKGRKDPGTFFVRKMRSDRTSPAMDDRAFYFAWRDAIQRYGIYNPFTKRGAIKGLLPHGPHCVRDVLATHVIKQTASYDLAAFAIQDTPEMVKNYYGRFLPEEKVGLAAKVLNKVWQRA
jgi:hypothetical protein